MQGVTRLVFLGPGCRLVVSEAALDRLLGYRQVDEEAREAGGVLLGRWVRDTTDYVVDRIGEPGSSDVRKRTFFRRARQPALRLIEEAWRGSAGSTLYLGEWHTHPEPNPTPSCLDQRGWSRIARKAKFVPPHLFFVIVGISRVGGWGYHRQSGTLQRMSLKEDSD